MSSGTSRHFVDEQAQARTSMSAQRPWWLWGVCVLVALVYLYVSAGVHMLSTWHQARRESAAVATMEREHRSLMHTSDGPTPR